MSGLACSEGASGRDEADPTAAGCEEIQISEVWPDVVPGHFLGLVDGSETRVLRIELAEVGDFRQKPGEFPLEEETRYQTCSHCVLVLEGGYALGDAAKVFVQASGTMTLTSVGSPPSQETAGSLSDVMLRQAEVDPSTGQPTDQRSGACLRLSSLNWDTRVPVGTPCLRASDCGDTSKKACDPSSATCVAEQCDEEPGACGEGRTCIAQTVGASWGTCYEDCVPFGDSCGEERVCVPRTLSQSHGMCVSTGSEVHGNLCEGSDVSTGCQAGLDCNEESGGAVCRHLCDYFASEPGCPEQERCRLGSVCSPEAGDTADIGETCSAGLYVSCGDDGLGHRGMCAGEPAEVAVCRKICRLDVSGDCPAGSACEVSLFDTVGVCVPGTT
jgi:hypothetical protein